MRAARTRGHISGSNRARLTVFKSNKYIYAQVIDDANQKTIAASFGKDPKVVGEKVAVLAIKAGTTTVVFDRSSYNYHGQVKLLAESARSAGLKF